MCLVFLGPSWASPGPGKVPCGCSKSLAFTTQNLVQIGALWTPFMTDFGFDMPYFFFLCGFFLCFFCLQS